ncbi:MAG TPA: hypothetical protein VH234_06230, partial [Candidatus Saccharimonadales bacterium]|nr:hypothetical protein [Candidatus Saccharimonadales bacterium]
MSQILRLTNFSGLNIVEQDQLTADAAPGASTLTVENARDFTTGYLLIGIKGSKTGELLPVN